MATPSGATPAAALVAIGSNIDPWDNVPRAVELLSRAETVTGVSRFYRTEPVGPPGQPPYVNGACRLDTRTPPRELKRSVLRGIEGQLGRRRNADRYAPRPIDLDLIVYDGLVVEEPDLRLPDPDIRQRAFVAGPAAELWPDYVLPESGESLRRLAGAFAAGLEVIPGFREAVLERIVS